MFNQSTNKPANAISADRCTPPEPPSPVARLEASNEAASATSPFSLFKIHLQCPPPPFPQRQKSTSQPPSHHYLQNPHHNPNHRRQHASTNKQPRRSRRLARVVARIRHHGSRRRRRRHAWKPHRGRRGEKLDAEVWHRGRGGRGSATVDELEAAAAAAGETSGGPRGRCESVACAGCW